MEQILSGYCPGRCFDLIRSAETRISKPRCWDSKLRNRIHSLSALAGKRKGRDLMTVFDSEPESDYVLEQLQKFRL